MFLGEIYEIKNSILNLNPFLLDASKWTSGINNNVQIINNRVRFNAVSARSCDEFTTRTQYILTFKMYIAGTDRGCLAYGTHPRQSYHVRDISYSYWRDINNVFFSYFYTNDDNSGNHDLTILSQSDGHWTTGEHSVKIIRNNSKFDFYFDDILIYKDAIFFDYSNNIIGAWKWGSSYIELYDFYLQ